MKQRNDHQQQQQQGANRESSVDKNTEQGDMKNNRPDAGTADVEEGMGSDGTGIS